MSEFSEQLDWTLDGTNTSVISAETTNGVIMLECSARDKVIVRAFKQVRAWRTLSAERFAKKVQVQVEQCGHKIKIYKDHPEPPWGISVSVTYEIQCPSAVDVNARTKNGKIELHGDAKRVHASSKNGKIKLYGAAERIYSTNKNGEIEASVKRLTDEGKFVIKNGSIDVELHEGAAPVSASAKNGSINLKLPSDWSGHLDAETKNGQVRADFPVPFTDKSKRRFSGKIGEGGSANVNLRTKNGGINLRKLL